MKDKFHSDCHRLIDWLECDDNFLRRLLENVIEHPERGTVDEFIVEIAVDSLQLQPRSDLMRLVLDLPVEDPQSLVSLERAGFLTDGKVSPWMRAQLVDVARFLNMSARNYSKLIRLISEIE